MTAFLAASKLTASWSGNREPATHAVPPASAFANARAICGQSELVVHVDGVDPVGFDPSCAYSCQRCVSKIGGHENAPRRQASRTGGEGPETRLEGISPVQADATESDMAGSRVFCGGYMQGDEITIEFPELDADELRQQSIDRYRDRLMAAVEVALRASEDLGKAKRDPRVPHDDFAAYSLSAERTRATAIRVLNETFRELGQALHDADAQVVWEVTQG